MSNLTVLLFVLLGACSSSGPDDDAPGGQGAGASASGGSSGTNAGTGSGGSGGGGAAGSGGSGGSNVGSGGSGGSDAGSGGAGDDAGAGTGGSGGTSVSGSGGGDPQDAGSKPPTNNLSDHDCVVAQRLDHCCTPWITLDHGEELADPCLVALGEPRPTSEETAACTPPLSECAAVDCAPSIEPPSRVPFKGDGMCMFGDECFNANECVLARDATRCCSCFEAMPKTLVDQELCLVTEGEAPDDAVCGSAECLTVLCAECEAPTEPTCAIGDALNRCN